MTYIDNYKFKRIFYILAPLGLWLSLDAHFLNFKLENFKDFLNLLRATIPFFIFIILIINLKKNCIKKFFKENNKISILCLILFIIQIPGLIYSENTFLNISFVINCLSYLLFLFFFVETSSELNFFLRISLIILVILFLFYGLGIFHWLLLYSENLNLYGSWPHGLVDLKFFSNTVPRSSGLARNEMIVYIIFSILLIVKKTNIFNIFIISFSFLMIILTQSRIVNIFFIGYLAFYLFIVLCLEVKVLKKIFILNLALILPLITLVSFIYFQKNKPELLKKFSTQNEINIKKKYADENYNTFFRPINDKNVGFGSGRISDWKNIILKNKNYIIGYGAMGDRFLINQSASNFFIYIYASSGILGLIIGILFL